jgi:hypothetical protein
VTGIQLYSPVHEESGRFMRLTFILERVGLIVVDGYLVSSVKVKVQSSDHYIWNVQFHSVPASIADKLVDWAEGRIAAQAARIRRKTTRDLPTVAPPREERVRAWRGPGAERRESPTRPVAPAVPAVARGKRPSRPQQPVEEPSHFDSDTTPVN